MDDRLRGTTTVIAVGHAEEVVRSIASTLFIRVAESMIRLDIRQGRVRAGLRDADPARSVRPWNGPRGGEDQSSTRPGGPVDQLAQGRSAESTG